MKIEIQPIQKQLTFLEIISVNVALDNSARIQALVGNDENLGTNYSLFMDSETYAEWGNDDNFVITWVCQELGITRKY
jgi:hypothetical protein